jgi:hypothetical protein
MPLGQNLLALKNKFTLVTAKAYIVLEAIQTIPVTIYL